MTVIRDIETSDINVTNYIASLALICGLATIVLMLNFRGFKASLNFGSKKKRRDFEYFPVGTDNISVSGSYRANREEFFGNGSLSEPRKKIDSSMVILPPNQAKFEYQNPLHVQPQLKQARSTSTINEPSVNIPVHLRKSTPNVSTDPRGSSSSYKDSVNLYGNGGPDITATEKEQKKQEITNIPKGDKVLKPLTGKSKVSEQKPVNTKQKKLAPQPKDDKEQKRKDKELKKQQAKEEKIKKEQLKAEKKKQKLKAPEQPANLQQMPVPAQRSNPLGQSTGYSTNTLESSISKASGPPPYSDIPDKLEVIPNKSDDTGNTSFGKKIDEQNSWDLVSKHRLQMGGESRPSVLARRPKQIVMDLKYNGADGGNSDYSDNTEA